MHKKTMSLLEITEIESCFDANFVVNGGIRCYRQGTTSSAISDGKVGIMTNFRCQWYGMSNQPRTNPSLYFQAWSVTVVVGAMHPAATTLAVSTSTQLWSVVRM